jgi:hypothetical protein
MIRNLQLMYNFLVLNKNLFEMYLPYITSFVNL